VSPYINKQLERLIERTQLTKSAIFTVAVEKYAREMDKVQGKDLVRQEALF
jgi:predicted DNA-binding protein